MSLTYEIDNKLKALTPVLERHAEWFGRVTRHLFYPEMCRDGETVPTPDSFHAWAKEASQDDFIETITLNNLTRIHDDLHKAAAGLISEAVKAGTKPDIKSFDALSDLYDEFITQLRRLELDCVLADSGLDAVSGLRSRKAMEKDMERELERLSRRGKPLCLVLAHIDNYDDILQNIEETQLRRIIKDVAALIKKSIRSFDDAYRSSDAEFAMILKHSELVGGTAAIDRLRDLLQDNPIAFQKDNQSHMVSLSYCAAEPVPEDKLNDLLKNMRSDLSRYDEGAGTSVEYVEQSPLERFIQTGQ